MIKVIQRSCGVVLIALFLCLTTATGSAASWQVDQVAWLSGCWQGSAGEEWWLPPLGGTMVGVNRGPEREAKQPSFEFLRIVEQETDLVYLASPGGRYPPTAFKATEVASDRAVFENPEHDFPQRITYWLEGHTLHARVEARQEEEWRGFEISWTAGGCPKRDF